VGTSTAAVEKAAEVSEALLWSEWCNLFILDAAMEVEASVSRGAVGFELQQLNWGGSLMRMAIINGHSA
jgi:hypothetical protein